MSVIIDGTSKNLTEFLGEFHYLIDLVHNYGVDWARVPTAEEEEAFESSSPEMLADYGSLANAIDDNRSQYWQSVRSQVRHFFHDIDEERKKNGQPTSVSELPKELRRSIVASFALRSRGGSLPSTNFDKCLALIY